MSGFNEIYVEDNVNVYLTQDSIYSVIVEAGENIVPLIKTEITNSTLFIRNDNRCNFTRSYDKPLNVYVSMPSFNYITSDGTGNITGLNTITTDSFDIRTKNSGDVELYLANRVIITRMHGSGDVILHGTTTNHFSDVGGSGYLKCADLTCSYMYLHTFSLGESYVTCNNHFTCKIDYHGDVYLYGNPPIVEKTKLGEGDLFLQ